MHFSEKEISNLKINKTEDFKKLIINFLCDSDNFQQIDNNDNELLIKFLEKAGKQGLNYEQFNEVLLLLNQDRVSKSFFNFFFLGKLLKESDSVKNEKITLDAIKNGVIDFRGYAMLCFGNFKFAYNKLSKKEYISFERIIAKYCHDCTKILKNRPKQMLDIKYINKEDTPYTGYLIRDDINTLFKKIKSGTIKENWLEYYIKDAEYQKDKMEMITKKAINNTKTYLTWDYMDIYIATSMRNTWEFGECFDFIQNLFKSDNLKEFKLRYFDPTQCYLHSRIDKSLVEGLMLKRAKCCIYMAQESDTLGKDSELASTLAQGKPVIAYIPLFTKSELDNYVKKIMGYPYDYFIKRIQILYAEDVFNNDKEMKKVAFDYSDVINRFLENARFIESDFKEKRDSGNIVVDFFNWKNEKKVDFMNKFKLDNKRDFEILCKIMAIAESQNFDKRAATLRKYHPLSVQVSLETGVANGLLVVREIKTCAYLLEKILTNRLDFIIKDMEINDKEKENCYSLIETLSNSPYRVVTKDVKLTNSFWNFYLSK